MKYPEQLKDWPMAEHSRQVTCRPHRWHVQEAGDGPLCLMLHGAGGATQSWRGVFPLLTDRFRVVAVDLPGQGFTMLGNRSRCGLNPMADDLMMLCQQERWQPALIVGHSAGAALAMRLWELTVPAGTDGPALIGINAALQNFGGMAGGFFSAMAKMLAANPFTATAFATTTTRGRVQKLLDGTGSRLDETGIGLYQRLISDRAHVDATLAMMSQWNLDGLIRRAPEMTARTLLIVGERDRAVPAGTSRAYAERLRNVELRAFPGLGHLAHEEAPEAISAAILEFAEAQGIL